METNDQLENDVNDSAKDVTDKGKEYPFLKSLFDATLREVWPELEITDDNRDTYFRIWCAGAFAHLRLSALMAGEVED